MLAGLAETKDDNVPTKTVVLQRNIPWGGYCKVGLMTEREGKYFTEYDEKRKRSAAENNEYLAANGAQLAEVFLLFVDKTNNLETLQYTLTLIHDLISADYKRVELFNSLAAPSNKFPYGPFFKHIDKSNKDYYSAKMACEIIGLLMSKSREVPKEPREAIFNYISTNLTEQKDTTGAHLALRTLQFLFSNDAFRLQFYKANHLPLLINIIKMQTSNFQLTYEAIYCVWLMSYNAEIASSLTDTGLIKALVDVIKLVSKEKVVRLAIASLRNLLDKADNNSEMIEAGFVRMLSIMTAKKWGDDDIVQDLHVLSEGLAKDMAVMSSFEVYKKEVLSGSLEWTPVHKSEKFWRENFLRFEENDYQVLRALQAILTNKSADPLTLSVAAFDVGEICRTHPRGRHLADQIPLKRSVMALLAHPNEEVKKQALFAVQKAMVTNWEYLATK